MSDETKKLIDVIENLYHISSQEEKEIMILNLINSAKQDGLRSIQFKEFVYNGFKKEEKTMYKLTFKGSQILAEAHSEQEYYFSEAIPIKKDVCFEKVEKRNIKTIETLGYERTLYEGKDTKIFNSLIINDGEKKYLSSFSLINDNYEEICFEKEIGAVEGLNEIEVENFNIIESLRQEVEFLYNTIIKTKTNINTKRLRKYL